MINSQVLTFKNRAVKKILPVLLIATIFIYVVVLSFTKGGFLAALLAGGGYVLIFLFTQPLRYKLTENNTFEAHTLFGEIRAARVDVERIGAISEKKNRLYIRHLKKGYRHASTVVCELYAADIQTLKNELSRRNPNIVVS